MFQVTCSESSPCLVDDVGESGISDSFLYVMSFHLMDSFCTDLSQPTFERFGFK
jgi:hypothetical protein